MARTRAAGERRAAADQADLHASVELPVTRMAWRKRASTKAAFGLHATWVDPDDGRSLGAPPAGFGA